ncbi:MAG: response regulator [Planctomycetota bacterium]
MSSDHLSAERDPADRLESAVDAVLSDMRVLFVDDNTLNCRIGHRLFSQLGAVVECATSGPEALTIAEEREFDVIVLDCAMPGMSGFDVAKRLLRPESKAAQTPIVALTVSGSQVIRNRAHEAGMNRLLCKPLSREAVLHAIIDDLPGCS